MDWLNELPSVTGIDRIVAEMAQRLMDGPVVFKSPYWEGDVVIRTLDDYRAWLRTTQIIHNELGTEERAREEWEGKDNCQFLPAKTLS